MDIEVTKKGEWIKSDDNQFIRRLYEDGYIYLFEVLQIDSKDFDDGKGVKYLCYSAIIDFADYTDSEVEDILKSYSYNSVDHVKELYGEGLHLQIIAECIAESEMQGSNCDIVDSFEKAKEWLVSHDCYEEFNIEIVEE